MEEALLNGDTTEFYNYIESVDFNVEILGLEAKIYYHCYTGKDCKSLVQKWESLPGDLRLFERCFNFYDFAIDVNRREMLRNKTLTGVTRHSFIRLCYSNYMQDPEYLNKLIIIQEPFSEFGLLHKQLLKKYLFREYLELSARYPFEPNAQWTKDVESHDAHHSYLMNDTEDKLGLEQYDHDKLDINALREKDIFPDLYHKVYLESNKTDKDTMRHKVLSCFDQLLFEERTLWVNILKPSLRVHSLRLIHDKDTFNTLFEFIDTSKLEGYRDSYYNLGYLATNCCVVVLELMMEKLPENITNKLKLWIMLHFNTEKTNYFFGDLNSKKIDDLVHSLI